MKKVFSIILGTTLLLGGCASSDAMQKQVDDLTSQVSSLSEEKEELEKARAEQDEHIEYLCAFLGERASESTIEYLGDLTFRHTLTGEIKKFDEMTKGCLEMIEAYQEYVEGKASSLLAAPEVDKTEE